MNLDTAFCEGGQPLEDCLELREAESALWDAELELESALAFLDQAENELKAYMQRKVQDSSELEDLVQVFNLRLERVNLAIKKLDELN